MNLNEEDISNRNSTMSFILCLFFGYLGAHKFYVGKWVQGIIYLLLGSSVLFNFIVSPIVEKLGYSWEIKSLGANIILSLLIGVAILYDLFAITNESSTDNKGLIVVSGKHKDEIYGRTDSEKFNDKLNVILTICVFIILFIIYYVILNYI